MAKVHLMIGIQGSGKSTFAKTLSQDNNITIVSTDVVRLLHPDWPEQNIWPEVYSMTANLLQNNQDVIFDATNITPKVRQRFIDNVLTYFKNYDKEKCSKLPFELIGYFFDTDPKLCFERVNNRNHMPNELFLPPEVVFSYHERLVIPTYDEPFTLIYVIKNDKTNLIEKKGAKNG